MAEGYLRSFVGDLAVVESAGTQAQGLNPLAVKVMAMDGVDISGHRSKTMQEVQEMTFDLIVTVCDHAAESCPTVPVVVRRIHAGFPDPAKAQGSDDDILNEFLKVRDMIKVFCANLAEEIKL